MATSFLTFSIGPTRYAISAESVQEVVRAVEVMPLPAAPPVVTGLIDYRGETIAVFDAASRFRHAARPVRAADRFIIARTARRVVALHVSEVDTLVEIEASDVSDAPAGTFPDVPVAGVARTDDGIVVIQELERFLSESESRQLDEAMAVR